jgi:cell division transport system permease protein
MALKVGYFVKEASQNLRRNKLMTVAAILTAGVSLLLLGGVMTLGSFVNNLSGDLINQVEVSVFLVDEITEAQRTDIRNTIDDLEVAKRVIYVTKEEAYEEFKDLYRDQPALWENITADVLPASFRVQLTDPERVDVIRSKFENNPAVEEIVDQRDTVERIVSFTSLLRTFSVVMVAVLLGAAVLLISNATQLAIYARRREIEIMKLVGATNWFVRLPFMLEGVAAGIAGATVAVLLLVAGKSLVKTQLPIWLPTGALGIGLGQMAGQIIALALIGIVVGALGSAVAVRRFLEA